MVFRYKTVATQPIQNTLTMRHVNRKHTRLVYVTVSFTHHARAVWWGLCAGKVFYVALWKSVPYCTTPLTTPVSHQSALHSPPPLVNATLRLVNDHQDFLNLTVAQHIQLCCLRMCVCVYEWKTACEG